MDCHKPTRFTLHACPFSNHREITPTERQQHTERGRYHSNETDAKRRRGLVHRVSSCVIEAQRQSPSTPRSGRKQAGDRLTPTVAATETGWSPSASVSSKIHCCPEAVQQMHAVGRRRTASGRRIERGAVPSLLRPPRRPRRQTPVDVRLETGNLRIGQGPVVQRQETPAPRPWPVEMQILRPG